jgi:putative ABC transport system permease protein
VEQHFGAVQPDRYLDRIERLDYTAALTRAPTRAGAVVLTIVAICVLAVTALGIFGLAAFTVTRRTQQIGTRRAFGASRLHIVRYFMIENWLITALGVIAGALLSVVLGIELAEALQLPRLPLHYIAAGSIVLWIVGTLAALLPALRAAAISPAVATRNL